MECCSGSTVQTTALLNIQDANTVMFDGLRMLENASSSGPCVNIADGGQNATTNLVFHAAACVTGAHNFIVNNVDTNFSVTNAMSYSYLTSYQFQNKNRGDVSAIIGNTQFLPTKFEVCGGNVFCYQYYRDSGTGWLFNLGSGQAGAEGFLFNRPIQQFGTAQTSGNIALSAGWGTSASVGTVSGSDNSQRFIITTGSASFNANPTVTITFPNAFGSGNNPTCTLNVTAVTGTAANIAFNQTTLSQTAPVFTSGLAGGW